MTKRLSCCTDYTHDFAQIVNMPDAQSSAIFDRRIREQRHANRLRRGRRHTIDNRVERPGHGGLQGEIAARFFGRVPGEFRSGRRLLPGADRKFQLQLHILHLFVEHGRVQSAHQRPAQTDQSQVYGKRGPETV